jgi:hypothetical protein
MSLVSGLFWHADSTGRSPCRTGPVESRRSRSRSDAAGALDWNRETSTILGRGLGNAVLPKPGRCRLRSPGADRGNFAAVTGGLVAGFVGAAAGDAGQGAGRCRRSPRATASGTRRGRRFAAPRSKRRERCGPAPPQRIALPVKCCSSRKAKHVRCYGLPDPGPPGVSGRCDGGGRSTAGAPLKP